ncbi:hypothetical protein [Novosphingobium huizhouense]|uniref:hypothetical protein n=1 Tax=Novosphingobium huizhouense TaxID=2866625 RepID=UPI001CD848EC|nr:hypothetical protein [Novosphingobium huizhouense]
MTTQYRFLTAHRTGKWYPDLRTAQEQAYAIGAGFLEQRTGEFYQYPGTRLETRVLEPVETQVIAA